MTMPDPERLQALSLVARGTLAADVTSVRDPQGQRLIVLRIEHATGSTVFPITETYARQLAGALLQECAGIQIARTVPNGKGDVT